MVHTYTAPFYHSIACHRQRTNISSRFTVSSDDLKSTYFTPQWWETEVKLILCFALKMTSVVPRWHNCKYSITPMLNYCRALHPYCIFASEEKCSVRLKISEVNCYVQVIPPLSSTTSLLLFGISFWLNSRFFFFFKNNEFHFERGTSPLPHRLARVIIYLWTLISISILSRLMAGCSYVMTYHKTT